MSWNWFKFLRISNTTMRDGLALTAGSPIYTLDRFRLALHNGTSWDEVAYRSDFPVGTLIFNEFNKYTTELFPAVPRNVDNDLDAAHWPILVPLLRAEKASVLGKTDFAVTVSGSTVTFSTSTEAAALLSLIKQDAIVSSYQNLGEPANFDGSANYGVYGKQKCLNIAGVDYVVTNINLVGYTATVTGSPPAGSQTACIYPYRIAGTTNARLLKISGLVGVVAGDAGGEIVAGFRKMDRFQGHYHATYYLSGGGGLPGFDTSGGRLSIVPSTTQAREATTDGTNGTPRTGKTTDPRTYGQYAYTWGGKYVA